MILLIDGRSGSGKTELARLIVAENPEWQLVRLDELYPGWHGLEAGSRHVHDHILASDEPRWLRWDWEASRSTEWVELDPGRPILIEGCGALSGANRRLATSAAWVQLDGPSRRQRALERDNGAYDPYWDIWAEQEKAFIMRERPRDLADLVVDGSDVAASDWRSIVG